MSSTPPKSRNSIYHPILSSNSVSCGNWKAFPQLFLNHHTYLIFFCINERHNKINNLHQKLSDSVLLRYIDPSMTIKMTPNITIIINFPSESCLTPPLLSAILTQSAFSSLLSSHLSCPPHLSLPQLEPSSLSMTPLCWKHSKLQKPLDFQHHTSICSPKYSRF